MRRPASPFRAPGAARTDLAPQAALAPPGCFIEVRVAAGRVEVVEFGDRGQTASLRALLGRFGLDMREEWGSPCG